MSSMYVVGVEASNQTLLGCDFEFWLEFSFIS